MGSVMRVCQTRIMPLRLISAIRKSNFRTLAAGAYGAASPPPGPEDMMFSKSVSMVAAAIAIAAPLVMMSGAANAQSASAPICGGKMTAFYEVASFYIGQDQRFFYSVTFKNNTGAQLTYSVKTGWPSEEMINLHGQKLAPAGEVTHTLGKQLVRAQPNLYRAPATADDLKRTTVASCY